jgi:hypothetical protein
LLETLKGTGTLSAAGYAPTPADYCIGYWADSGASALLGLGHVASGLFIIDAVARGEHATLSLADGRTVDVVMTGHRAGTEWGEVEVSPPRGTPGGSANIRSLEDRRDKKAKSSDTP